MKFYSTNRKSPEVSLREAVLRGLPPDNGLYMPEQINRLSNSFIKSLGEISFAEIAYEVSRTLIGTGVDKAVLRKIADEAFDFGAPTVKIAEQTHILELFHGPTLAFKDYGARFMARLMGHFNEGNERELHILAATSGDTGSAVAHGFLGVPGIRVTVLYPKGKVSEVQEKQFATLGENITALEIDGTFDDCQALVKTAFLDADLTDKVQLSSANSINISRLVPQTFYYFYAFGEARKHGEKVAFSIPSGNYGNLTAGLLAEAAGLPVHRFLAAANANDTVPEYLRTGTFRARPSVATLSNAMDVGDPSNFRRIKDLLPDLEQAKSRIAGFTYSDEQTKTAVRECYEKTGYLIDPHGAVAYAALQDYLKTAEPGVQGVILETAHPVKFPYVAEELLNITPETPERLRKYLDRKTVSSPMPNDYAALKEYLSGAEKV